jgi:hypothetical protein
MAKHHVASAIGRADCWVREGEGVPQPGSGLAAIRLQDFPYTSHSRRVTIMAEPTKEELMARIAELEQQVGGRKRGALDFKVSEKGGASVYGLGRFPVTLYYEQWTRLLDSAEALRSFLEANKDKLKLKSSSATE